MQAPAEAGTGRPRIKEGFSCGPEQQRKQLFRKTSHSEPSSVSQNFPGFSQHISEK
jgi:hypothetical protein